MLLVNKWLPWVQVIELPVKHPELFESLGIDQPKVSRGPGVVGVWPGLAWVWLRLAWVMT